MKNFVRNFLRKKEPSDRTKKYWDIAGNEQLEKTMEKICFNFDKDTFENEKDSIVFELNIPFSKESIVLDLACGIGRTCKWVSPKVKEYFGVDFIPGMIKKAKIYNKKFDNAKFFMNDGKTLKIFEDETFDLAYCELAFLHMLKPIQSSYIREIFRVLKKNGLFYCQLPKITFYKDDSYALTDDEVETLLKDFEVTQIKTKERTNSLFYSIKAKKVSSI